MIAFWVSLSFFAMLLPALACFSKLKRDKRHTYRHAPAAIPNKYAFVESQEGGMGKLIIQFEPTILETDPSELEEVFMVHDLFGTCFFCVISGTRYVLSLSLPQLVPSIALSFLELSTTSVAL